MSEPPIEARKRHAAGKDPCQRYACKLQDCLEANNYQESRCGHVIQEILTCCSRHRELSVVCSGFLKQLSEPKHSK